MACSVTQWCKHSFIAPSILKWLERRVVTCEARVSRSLVEAVDGGVLRMAACSEAVWLTRSGVLY
jgi:hypothetical protein